MCYPTEHFDDACSEVYSEPIMFLWIGLCRAMCTCVLVLEGGGEAGRSIRSPGAGVIGGWEISEMGAGI